MKCAHERDRGRTLITLLDKSRTGQQTEGVVERSAKVDRRGLSASTKLDPVSCATKRAALELRLLRCGAQADRSDVSWR